MERPKDRSAGPRTLYEHLLLADRHRRRRLEWWAWTILLLAGFVAGALLALSTGGFAVFEQSRAGRDTRGALVAPSAGVPTARPAPFPDPEGNGRAQ